MTLGGPAKHSQGLSSNDCVVKIANVRAFVFIGTTPDLRLMQEQHLNLARTYEKLGIEVRYTSWSAWSNR